MFTLSRAALSSPSSYYESIKSAMLLSTVGFCISSTSFSSLCLGDIEVKRSGCYFDKGGYLYFTRLDLRGGCMFCGLVPPFQEPEELKLWIGLNWARRARIPTLNGGEVSPSCSLKLKFNFGGQSSGKKDVYNFFFSLRLWPDLRTIETSLEMSIFSLSSTGVTLRRPI